MIKTKIYKWHVYFINCDCAGHYEARRREVPGTQFMRCQLCGKQIYDERDCGIVYADSDREAIRKVREGKCGTKSIKN